MSCHWPKMTSMMFCETGACKSCLAYTWCSEFVCSSIWQNVYSSNHGLPCQRLPGIRQTTFWKPPSFMNIPIMMPIAASVWLCKLICLFFYFLSCIDLHKLEINYEREYILKWANTFCSIIPLAIAYNKSSTRVWRGKEGNGIWWSQWHPGLSASVRQVFNQLLGNKWFLHKAAGPTSKAAADLRKPFTLAEEIHFTLPEKS